MVPDYVSYVVGYRFWKLYQGKLYSAWYDEKHWPFRQPYESESPSLYVGNILGNTGIHAHKSKLGHSILDLVRLSIAGYWDKAVYAVRTPEFLVEGKVALWGEVAEHRTGYRASKAYPLEITRAYLCLPERSLSGSMDLLRINYGIEVNVNESDWKRDQEIYSGAPGATGTIKT